MQQGIRTLLVGFVIGTFLGIIVAYLAGSGYFVNWVKLSPPNRVVFVELLKSQGGQLFVEGSDGRSYVCDRFDMFGFLYKPNDCKQRDPVTLGDAEIEFLKPCDRATVPFSWLVGPPAGIADCVQDRTFFRTARRNEASDSAYVLDQEGQLWGWHHPLPFQGRGGYLALFIAAYSGIGSLTGLYMANLVALVRVAGSKARKLIPAATLFALCNVILIYFVFGSSDIVTPFWYLLAVIPLISSVLLISAQGLGKCKWLSVISIEIAVFYGGLLLFDLVLPNGTGASLSDSPLYVGAIFAGIFGMEIGRGGWLIFALLAAAVQISAAIVWVTDHRLIPRWFRVIVSTGVAGAFMLISLFVLYFFMPKA